MGPDWSDPDTALIHDLSLAFWLHSGLMISFAREDEAMAVEARALKMEPSKPTSEREHNEGT
jgi:hypothetical protein